MPSAQSVEQSVPAKFHVTRAFVADFGELERDIGVGPAKSVYAQIVAALEAIRGEKAYDSLPITPYGYYGDSFQYQLNSEYVLTFKRATDREPEGRPLLFHYYLKNLFRQQL